MNRLILPLVIVSAMIGGNAYSQSNRAFAVTSEAKGSVNWLNVQEVNLNSGSTIKTIYNPSATKSVSFDGNSTALRGLSSNSVATENGVAAAAYDAKNNRLYYTLMHGTDLRYFDLNATESKVVINNDAQFSTGVKVDESNVITRMTFAADGFGYALTNDGNQLIRFSTGAQPEIVKLGSLIDSKKNKDISVHVQCTSWGGDLVGDIYGNLYLFTMRNNIFKININTREAEFVGTIKNLPADFTTNGAAADEDGNVIVASAVNNDSYYKVNLSTLNAVALTNKGEVSLTSTADLASGNLIFQNKTATVSAPVTTTVNANIEMYPNPVINHSFNVQFGKLPAGNYTIEISDINGRKIITKTITVNGAQNSKMSLPSATNSGLYMVRIFNASGAVVYTNKLAVE